MENLAWGLQMTVLGMGLVFALLALLWGLLTLVLVLDKDGARSADSKAANAEAERIAAIADDAVGAQTPELAMVNGIPAERVAAIVIAALKHRQALRRTAQATGDDAPATTRTISPWLAAGRVLQNTQWQPRGK